jgi:zinc protease
MDLAISNATLANGLRVVLVRDPHAQDIQVTMRYGVGAVDDPAGQSGIAHLVEHLMFQQVVGNETIFAKLESQARGFNAFTSADATTFVTRAAPEQLEALLSIEAVRFGFRCTSITPSAFERERAVVVNELKMRGRSDEIFAALHRSIYTEMHPYARTSTPAQVGEITMAQACAFADAHYAPTNAVLVVSGNISEASATEALGKMISRLPRRDAVLPPVIKPAPGATVKTKAPLSDDAVVIAWPMPTDPSARARAYAVAGIVAGVVDDAVKGRVIGIRLGDERAPMYGFVILTREDDKPDDVIANVRRAISAAPSMLPVEGRYGELIFNIVQQSALFSTFASFDDGSDRDSTIAAQVLAGLDPKQSLSAALASIRTLTPRDMRVLIATLFAFDRASIAVLEADEQTKGGTEVAVTKPVHDVGQYRDVPDPAAASLPAAEPLSARVPDALTSRTLPNGLRIVLLPVTSVPTVDVRLVFTTGSADEPETQRGIALLAAHMLQWRGRDFEDYLALNESGGDTDVDVGTDEIVFSARGLDMHIDYLLTGLRKLVIDGSYRGGARSMARVLRAMMKASDDRGPLTDAYLRAHYGDAHPYVTAGVPRHVSPRLTVADMKQFRAAHFTPDNATLVISGRFDTALANKWIDHLFTSWKGHGAPRATPRAAIKPASLASDENLAQVQIMMAVPATVGTRAERLVGAEMLRGIVNDVRHQLGAAYTFDASYSERRLSTSYSIAGATDASRTADAITLVRDRLALLRSDPEATARAFVTARRRVLASLSAQVSSASALGDAVTRDLALGRGLFANARLAQEVHALTVERMAPALADLALDGAAIVMRGPKAEVTRAFAVLGRTPEMFATRSADSEEPELSAQDSASSDDDDDESSSARLLLGVAATYSSASVRDTDLTGTGLSLHVGANIENSVTAGLLISYASYAGMHEVPYKGTQPLELEPFAASLFVQRTFLDRIWASALIGFHFDGLVLEKEVGQTWNTAFSVGLEAGVDIVRWQGHRLTAMGRYITEVDSSAEYSALTLGLGYRFY